MNHNINIPQFDVSSITFIDDYTIHLDNGDSILLGTYEIRGNHVLVLYNKSTHIGFQEVSYSRQEIFSNYQALLTLLSTIERSHKISLLQHIKVCIVRTGKKIITAIRNYFK